MVHKIAAYRSFMGVLSPLFCGDPAFVAGYSLDDQLAQSALFKPVSAVAGRFFGRYFRDCDLVVSVC